MSRTKRTWEKLTDEEKSSAKEELILFFENERDEKIGVIAAEKIINFFLQSVGGGNSITKELMMQKRRWKIE